MEGKSFYEFGPFRVDPVERLLTRGGTVLPLPPKTFDTLLLLVHNGGHILGKEELLKAIWPDTFVEETSLAQNISLLRKALGESAGERQYIETIPRRGYRFLANVEERCEPDRAIPLEPVRSNRTVEQEKEARGRRRSRVPSVVVAAVAVLVLAFLISRRWFFPVWNDVNAYRLTPLATAPGLEVHPSWAPNGKTIAYAGEINGTFQVFTKTLGSSTPVQVTRQSRDCYFPIWSRDGRQILFTSGANTYETSTLDLWSVGAAGGEPKLLLQNVRQATLSADGKALAFIRAAVGTGLGELWVSSPPGAPPRRYSERPFADRKYLFSSFVQFSPDGSKIGVSLMLTASKPEFWILPFPSGNPFQELTTVLSSPLMIGAEQFSWMADGRHVVFAQHILHHPDPHLWIADTKSGAMRALTEDTGAEQAPAVSPDGSRVAFQSFQGTYDLVEVSLDGSPMRDYLATARNEVTPAWSPLGAHLAYVTDRNGPPEIWLKNVQEGWERAIVTQKDFGPDRTFSLFDACFSPDGQRVAYRRTGDSGEAIWISTISGDPPMRLARQSNDAFQRGPAWSPDGNWIAYYSAYNGRYAVVMKARVNGEGEPVVLRNQGYYPRWSPKGDWILSRGEGLFLTSPDGRADRKISARSYVLHGWSKDGSLVYGIRRTETRHLVLEAIDPETSEEKLITDFGPVPASMRFGELNGTISFRGFSMNPSGRSFLTSVFRSTSDIWMLEGFR